MSVWARELFGARLSLLRQEQEPCRVILLRVGRGEVGCQLRRLLLRDLRRPLSERKRRLRLRSRRLPA